MFSFLEITQHAGVATVWMNRPELHNAFNAQLIHELYTAFQQLDNDADVRAVVLAARGKSFSAGADLNWMKSAVTASTQDNHNDALALSNMLHALATLRKPTIARVQGAAIGGGMGLVSACDICVAADTAKFATSEVKLGLIPSVISPYVIMQTFMQNTGAYLSDIVSKTFNLYAYEPNDWIGGWTLFYWGWWLAWSPFVGLFIARISRGRTIREFVRGVLLVPAGFTLLWMTVFGDTAIHAILYGGMESFGVFVQEHTSQALFVFLEQLPFASITSGLAICMVVVFFVTSADSGALVVDLLASKDGEPSPVWQRIFWSALSGIVAIALLLADGLQALQTATIASALPFSIILLIAIWGLFKALQLDATKRHIRYQTVARSQPVAPGQPWQKRLRNLIVMPKREQVCRFLDNTVEPAMQAVAAELRKSGFDAKLTILEPSEEQPERALALDVEHHGAYQDFRYKVRPVCVIRPTLRPADAKRDDEVYYRAEVFLSEGGQDYDVMGWSQDEVIGDILDQYERHRHFLHLVHDNDPTILAENTPNGES